MCSGTEKTIQTFSIERSLDFFRISITYRSYCISKNNSTFQEVCIFVCFQFIRCKIIIRKSCDSLNSLYIPYSLEFQIVNCHNCLDSPEKFILLEGIMQIYRNKTCLPVMAVNHVRAESDDRKHGKNCFWEESKLLDKIKLDSFVFHMHNANIAVFVSQIHIKMSNVFHFIFPFLFHTGIFRQDNTDIKIALIKTFRKCTSYIGKSSCFNKWYRFWCCK